MPTSRANHAVSVVNGKIYVCGGGVVQPALAPLSTVEVYDPKTDKWEQLPDMPSARGVLSSSVVDDKIYVIGGLNFGGNLSTVEEYTPEGWPFAIFFQDILPSKWGWIKR
jgi:N-acetylneuraminic acid mutarotase